MTQKAGNLRVKRMQKLLREALIDLIEERGFDALTVGELTERAMVSRAAFYRHYQDKYGLVEQIFEEAMQALYRTVEERRPHQHRQHPPEVWVTFFEHIAEYERLYRALLGSKGSSWFARKMRGALFDLVSMHGPGPGHGHGHKPSADPFVLSFVETLVPDLVSTSIVETITWWLEQGRPSTPREMAMRCSLVMSALFKEVSTWH
jgi:AcrR family transcriptional regulator